MPEIFIIFSALAIAQWACWPPRGMQRRWLLFGLLVLWVMFIGVGFSRGVVPGFVPWLVILSGIGAIIAWLIVWSVVNLLALEQK